jgi:hypothetical protein
MKNLCIDLDFKFPLLKNENLKEKYKEQRHKLIDTTDLNEDFCKLIKIKNLRFAHSQVFYLTPFSFMEVHQDEKMSLKTMSEKLSGYTCKVKYRSFGYVGTERILERYPHFTEKDYITLDRAVDIILSD